METCARRQRHFPSIQEVPITTPADTGISQFQLDPREVVNELVACGITHAVTVPDYVMLSVYREMERRSDAPEFIWCATEDEVVTICAGLHIGGATPMVMMQNQGLYASLNAVRAVGLDARLPLFMLIGQFGREYSNLSHPSTESARPVVRSCERVLDALDIPHLVCDRPSDVGNIGSAFRMAHDRMGASAALVGNYTAWLADDPDRESAENQPAGEPFTTRSGGPAWR